MRTGIPFRSFLPLFILLLILQFTATPSFAAHRKFGEKGTEDIANTLGTQLGLPNAIHVQIVDNNPLGFSVEPVAGRDGAYLISIDATFLNRLDEVELRAAVAHELGHVWIFTHHPYLQTEVLANQIAARIVSRDVLERVYTKLWAFKGIRGKWEDVFGPTSADRQSSPVVSPL